MKKLLWRIAMLWVCCVGLLNAFDLDIPFSMNVMAITREFLQKNPDTVERVVKAYIEAVGAMNHDKTTTLKVLAKYFKRSDPNFLDETYALVIKFTEKTPRVDARILLPSWSLSPSKGSMLKHLLPK